MFKKMDLGSVAPLVISMTLLVIKVTVGHGTIDFNDVYRMAETAYTVLNNL